MLPLNAHRLILRRFLDADAEAFLAYRRDPEVARYQDWDGSSRADATAFLNRQKIQEPGVPGEWFQIAIALKTTDALIGDCGVQLSASDPRQATIGVTLARQHQKQGFAVEALSCLFDYLFRQTNLHRIVADTDPQNVGAWRLLERLGMRREGHTRQSLWFKGRWADAYLYAILSQEWLAQRPVTEDRQEATHETGHGNRRDLLQKPGS